jgi:hypothetical protein
VIVVDRDINPGRVKPKTIKLVFVASLLLSMQLRTKTGRLGIGILINVPEWSDMSSHNAKKEKNPGHLYLTFFTGLPVTLNTQLFF